jgi:hypothetical protein
MSVNCQHSSPSGGAGEGCSPVFFWGGGGGGGGRGVAPGRGGEDMNDHSKLEARQNSISWHILVFGLHLEGSSYYSVHVLCSVFDYLCTLTSYVKVKNFLPS